MPIARGNLADETTAQAAHASAVSQGQGFLVVLNKP
jgi:hypothetical protein